jgi:hypothetical protein
VQAAAYLLRDVEERTERPGREHAVAGTQQDPRARQVEGEMLQQGRLAHTRLAFEQHETAFTATRLPRKLGQGIQRRLPLNQSHPVDVLFRRAGLDKREPAVRHATSSVADVPDTMTRPPRTP